jgi:hypothetical protein
MKKNIESDSLIRLPALLRIRRPSCAILTALTMLAVGSSAFADDPFAGFINHGLVGVGRLPAASFDQLGEGVDTLGGVFSSMHFDPTSWSRSGDAVSGYTYSGTLYGLPDRGFGDGTTDYHPRLQTFSFSITPYYGTGATNQSQIVFANTNTLVLHYDGGTNFTGFDPDDLAASDFPQSSTNSPGQGHRSIDAEGLARAADGGWFISDEYGPFIYKFDATGGLQYTLRPPEALLPKRGNYPGDTAFTATNNPTSGRRSNRGLEGVTLTPDGKRLVTVLQNATIQDGGASNGAKNTRLLVFDVDETSPTMGRVIAEYVYQLTLNGNAATNRNTPLSEVLALNNTQFLVLERDGQGLGADTNAPTYKKVNLLSLEGATNVVNTGYDLEKGAPNQLTIPATTLPVALAPTPRMDFVDMLDPNDLARFGMNRNGGTAQDNNTICEKWEGLALIPLNDPEAPNDYLLLVGNDNDFKSPVVYHNSQPVGTNTTVVDMMLLAYRVTLPTIGAAAPTNQLPAVSLSGPTNVTLSAPAGFALTANAYDQDGLITNVVFFQGAVEAGSAQDFPFQLPVDGLTDGVYEFTAVAYDQNGASATSGVFTVTVVATNLAPDITWLSPTNGSVVRALGALTLSASAGDADGTVAGVEFFEGSTSLGLKTPAPYSLTLSNLAAGVHVYHAVAYDNHGETATTAEFTVTSLLAPAITQQPSSITNEVGASVTFLTQIIGDEPLSLQWRYNGSNAVAGGTSTNLDFAAIDLTNAGNYQLIVSNPVGAVTSVVAKLVVILPNSTNIFVGSTIYSAYRPNLVPGTPVYVDADPDAGTPIRATQRSLGFREVIYKAAVSRALAFGPVSPSLVGGSANYDYTTQANKTNLVGFWVSKDVPILIGPDGNAYITDGHHTTAGYLGDGASPRQWIPGYNKLIIGHVVANYYNEAAGPQPLDDSWWIARAAENNAFLYGPLGSPFALPEDPGYAGLQPVLPSVEAMPTIPSMSGPGAMTHDHYRGLMWGIVDAVVKSATDAKGGKIAGFKKEGFRGPDVLFVEFYWADYLRNRVIWDDSKTGSPLDSGAGDANAVSAPLSFFAAAANGIALSRSKDYHDQYGRNVSDYLNTNLFSENIVYWAQSTFSNGLAKATDTYHLYLRDDSTIAGDITPPPASTNILHIDTEAGLVVSNTIRNLRSLWINAGGTLKTAWKDSVISNTTLTLPAGIGEVTLSGDATVSEETTLSGGTLDVAGILHSALIVNGGVLHGAGIVDGSVTVNSNGVLNLDAGALTVQGSLNLKGATVVNIHKLGGVTGNASVSGISDLTYGGQLTLVFTGEALADGDVFHVFSASNYHGVFPVVALSPTQSHLSVDVSNLTVDGSIRIVTSNAVPEAQPDGFVTAKGVALHIPLSKVLTNDLDFDHDLIVVESVSGSTTNGGSAVLNGDEIVFTPAAEFEGVDRFSYTVSDGHGGTSTGDVEVFVAEGPLPGENMIVIAPVETGFRLRFAGTPGANYELQRSNELKHWFPVTTTVAPLHGVIEWVDAEPGDAVYYRLVAK